MFKMTETILSLQSAEKIQAFTAAGHWRDRTIYRIVRDHAEATPDRSAIRDRHHTLTWRDLIDLADRLAARLIADGVRPGQRVSYWLPDRIEAALLVLACSRNGYVVCPSPHRSHTVAEVAALMERLRATAFFYQPGFGADASGDEIADALGDLGSLRRCDALPPSDGGLPFGELVVEVNSANAGAPVTDPNRVSYIAFTSGSTGQPKGVMHSDSTQLVTAYGISTDWNLGPDDVVYSLSPFSHNLGMGAMLTSFVAGSEFVIHDIDRRSKSLVDRLLETNTSYLIGVPTHAIDLLQELNDRKMDKLGRLRAFRVSGAATPAPVMLELLEKGIEPQSGYGMTETNGHQYTRPGDGAARITGSCGRATAGYEVRIFDLEDRNRTLPPGDIGQLGGRGASLMLGYFNDQIATESALNDDGWFMTGDLGRIDEDGYLTLTGRGKEVIIRGGHNINPARIEDLAMQHPDVDRAAALSVPDDRLGERICLAVMYRSGAAPGFSSVMAHLAANGLSKFEMPEFSLELDDIPLMSNGKIQKGDVARWIADGTVVPQSVAAKETV